MEEVKPYIIGIAGGSASGKTTLINRLNKMYQPGEICVISQDHYYKPLSEQVIDDNGEINFRSTCWYRLSAVWLRDIRKLKKGQDVNIVEYTFNNPTMCFRNRSLLRLLQSL